MHKKSINNDYGIIFLFVTTTRKSMKLQVHFLSSSFIIELFEIKDICQNTVMMKVQMGG